APEQVADAAPAAESAAAATEAAPPASTGGAAPMGGPTASEEAAFDRPTPSRPPQPARTPRFEPLGGPTTEAALMPQQMAPAARQVASLETPPPAPQIATPGVVLWANRASPMQFSDAYPSAARAANVSGRVQLSCQIGADFRANCFVQSETPAGQGFGDA